ITVDDFPIAVCNVSEWNVTVDTTITFYGNGSWDPDGSITNYTWNFTDVVEDTYYYVSIVNYTFTEVGDYTIILQVTDNDGQVTSYEQFIRVRSS
ncbi:MAG: PKD domain-containing protein, partial [candidate division Zixibacteria bacterium]|nr:PKD domain-containing protein [candidate division Zixibacteria bacterium]NIR65559.1 PKD domain-containing protein [candidate division Zixibacteria bacterium]NIS47246.1 PKD domain-containing protein [candidate division Zixibacteria bacterium]NIU15385.1 PKD domain-containing protein [candidate division Zixibacteria bacterium]NIX57666.1 PKD domain-containing protein [candidate division Zixibacteria bacterium]